MITNVTAITHYYLHDGGGCHFTYSVLLLVAGKEHLFAQYRLK